MNDSVSMRFIGDLNGTFQHLVERQCAFFYPLGESVALQVLHDKKLKIVLATDVV